jgi:TRAP-type C4-dicarboxylate transport system permease small subunit
MKDANDSPPPNRAVGKRSRIIARPLWWIVELLTRLLAAATLLAVCLQVLSRHGGLGIPWTEEATRYFFIWLVFLAAAAMARHGAHIAIDLVEELAGPRLRKGLLVLADLALVAFAAIVGVGGWKLMQVNWTTTAPASGIPIAWIQAVLPAFGILMAVFAIAHLLDVLRGRADDPNS